MTANIKKKIDRVSLGWTGSRVDPLGRLGFTGPTSKRVLTSTRPVPGPSRPGPGSTCRAGPSFKTLGETKQYNFNRAQQIIPHQMLPHDVKDLIKQNLSSDS